MAKVQLEKSYLETIYSVLINGIRVDVNIGEAVPTVINDLLDNNKSAVILTAFNPRSQTFSLHENKSRNNILRAFLVKNNDLIFDAVGQGSDSSWPAEESFFIIGISKEEAEKLAVEYGQYAYVWLDKNKPASLIFSSVWSE